MTIPRESTVILDCTDLVAKLQLRQWNLLPHDQASV